MFRLVLIVLEAVRPYPRAKQVRPASSQAKKRTPLQEAPNRINEGRKRASKKSGPKRNHQPVATRIPRKDEYSLENLLAIFEEEEKAEEKLEFKATSTPFDSQLMNSQIIQEEQINNQRQLDLEINKIHDSINKESIMLLIEELSPQNNNRTKPALTYKKDRRQKKQTKPKKSGQDTVLEKKPKASKSDTRKPPEHAAINDIKPNKRSKKADSAKELKKESAPVVNKRNQSRDNSKQKTESHNSILVSKRRTRLESKSKGNLHQTQKVPAKSKPKLIPKLAIKGTITSKVRFKSELTYRQLLLKCAKGKDPIDLLV